MMIASCANKRPSDNGTHACSHCGKVFARKYNMKVHEITHMKVADRPFGCMHCKERFVQRSNLKRHLKRRHQLPFSCPKCQFRAPSRQMLTEHARTVHQSEDCQPRINPAGRSYACPCKTRFKTYEDLDAHQRECTIVVTSASANTGAAAAATSSPPMPMRPSTSSNGATHRRRTRVRPRPAPLALGGGGEGDETVSPTDLSIPTPSNVSPSSVTLRSRSKKRKPMRYRRSQSPSTTSSRRSHSPSPSGSASGAECESPRRKAQRCLSHQAVSVVLPASTPTASPPPVGGAVRAPLTPSPTAAAATLSPLPAIPLPPLPMPLAHVATGSSGCLQSLLSLAAMPCLPQIRVGTAPFAAQLPCMSKMSLMLKKRGSSVHSERTETESVHSVSSPTSAALPSPLSVTNDSGGAATDIEPMSDDDVSSPVPPPVSISLPPAAAADARPTAASSVAASPGRVPAPRNTDPFCQTGLVEDNIDDSIDSLLGLGVKSPAATPCAPPLPLTSVSTMSLINGSSCDNSSASTASILSDSLLSCTSAAPSTTSLLHESILSCSGPSTASLLNGPSLSAGALAPMTPMMSIPPFSSAAAAESVAPPASVAAASTTAAAAIARSRPVLDVLMNAGAIEECEPKVEANLSDLEDRIPSLRTPPHTEQSFFSDMSALPALNIHLPSPDVMTASAPPLPPPQPHSQPPLPTLLQPNRLPPLRVIMELIPEELRQQYLTQAITQLQKTHPEIVVMLHASVLTMGNALVA